jgi:hypothetical protein
MLWVQSFESCCQPATVHGLVCPSVLVELLGVVEQYNMSTGHRDTTPQSDCAGQGDLLPILVKAMEFGTVDFPLPCPNEGVADTAVVGTISGIVWRPGHNNTIHGHRELCRQLFLRNSEHIFTKLYSGLSLGLAVDTLLSSADPPEALAAEKLADLGSIDLDVHVLHDVLLQCGRGADAFATQLSKKLDNELLHWLCQLPSLASTLGIVVLFDIVARWSMPAVVHVYDVLFGCWLLLQVPDVQGYVMPRHTLIITQADYLLLHIWAKAAIVHIVTEEHHVLSKQTWITEATMESNALMLEPITVEIQCAVH